ncbi:MAG: BamA/TamA family outer membrane protein, partial [Thermodesulfobacteriota bacterium]
LSCYARAMDHVGVMSEDPVFRWADRVVLDVAVEEDKTGTFSIMGGYSSADGPEATISVGDKNFLGTGDIAKASLTYGEYAKGFDLSFTDPYALGPRLSLGVDLFGKETFASPYQSYDSTFYGAKVAVLGLIPQETVIDWNVVIFNSLTIKGIYGREMYETWYKMTVIIQSGLDITPVITHHFHYTEFEKGFEVMRSGRSGKVILRWFDD